MSPFHFAWLHPLMYSVSQFACLSATGAWVSRRSPASYPLLFHFISNWPLLLRLLLCLPNSNHTLQHQQQSSAGHRTVTTIATLISNLVFFFSAACSSFFRVTRPVLLLLHLRLLLLFRQSKATLSRQTGHRNPHRALNLLLLHPIPFTCFH